MRIQHFRLRQEPAGEGHASSARRDGGASKAESPAPESPRPQNGAQRVDAITELEAAGVPGYGTNLPLGWHEQWRH